MNIVCIVAHQDDIEVLCGGTLLKYRQKGNHQITNVTISNGDKGGQYDPSIPYAEITRIRVAEADRVGLRLEHVLHNEGLWPVELAPWGITQLPLGGVAVLPMPPHRDEANRLPDRVLTLWPFTQWSDPRLEFYDDFLLVRGQAWTQPFKIGYLNRAGWLGYLRDSTFFVKRFLPDPDRLYPDRGSNAECFCNHELIELETLAPLDRLEPGQSVMHIEDWEIFTGVDAAPTPDGIRSLMQTLKL